MKHGEIRVGVPHTKIPTLKGPLGALQFCLLLFPSLLTKWTPYSVNDPFDTLSRMCSTSRSTIIERRSPKLSVGTMTPASSPNDPLPNRINSPKHHFHHPYLLPWNHIISFLPREEETDFQQQFSNSEIKRQQPITTATTGAPSLVISTTRPRKSPSFASNNSIGITSPDIATSDEFCTPQSASEEEIRALDMYQSLKMGSQNSTRDASRTEMKRSDAKGGTVTGEKLESSSLTGSNNIQHRNETTSSTSGESTSHTVTSLEKIHIQMPKPVVVVRDETKRRHIYSSSDTGAPPQIVISAEGDDSPISTASSPSTSSSSTTVSTTPSIRVVSDSSRSMPRTSLTIPQLFQVYRLCLVSFGSEALPQAYLQDLIKCNDEDLHRNMMSISHHYMQFNQRYAHFLKKKLFYVDVWMMHERLNLDTHFDAMKQKRLLAYYDGFMFTMRHSMGNHSLTDVLLLHLQKFTRLVPNATIYLLLFDFYDKEKVLEIARTLSLMDVRVFDVTIGGEIVSNRRKRNSGVWASFDLENPEMLSSLRKRSSLLSPVGSPSLSEQNNAHSYFNYHPSSDDESASPSSMSSSSTTFQSSTPNTHGLSPSMKRKKSDLTLKISSILLNFDDRYHLIPTHATDRDLLQEHSSIDIVSQLLRVQDSTLYTDTLLRIGRHSLHEPTLNDVMYGPLTEYLKPKDRRWVYDLNPSKIFLRLGWNSLKSRVRVDMLRQFFTLYIFPKLLDHCYVFHRHSYKNLRTYSAYLHAKGKWETSAFENHPFSPPKYTVCTKTGDITVTYWMVHQRVTRYFFTRKSILFPRHLTECRLTVTDDRYSVSRRWTLVRLFFLSLCCCFCCGKVKF